jgi:hypothetical protein
MSQKDLSLQQHHCGNLKSLKPCHRVMSRFVSLDTAGNTFLAACTKNVCFHPWMVSIYIMPACLSEINAHIVSIARVIKQQWQNWSANSYVILHYCQASRLTLRLLMSCMYGAPILDVSRLHTAVLRRHLWSRNIKNRCSIYIWP